ncbi:hypothetical protein MAIC_15490 [Mycolicibacterium aichiense]|uniref:Uncharacterized protein n=1 Tax=Mycolicibacterium aichiense TaxID=1799 RepID=A0AAD1HKG4_9MYCO|nr:hypothetical protein [Mycolicibacterium aichiense]MCV7017645.1 hypothetical protein [Mycolicibacterium aichiense]BBX06746.1 hypothetical protein MAIC_15490 [Mycolicibacterium aichiense]
MAKKSSDQDLAYVILAVIAFFAVAWPYLLGTWLAVRAGAENPSTERSVTGWVFEAIWLIILASIVIVPRVQSAREQAEKARAEEEARRLAALKEQRKVDFGLAGAQRYEEAAVSVARIARSEAARTGWLGDDPAAYDFRADLKAIADNLRKAEKIRSVTADASSIRTFTESDKQMLRDAKAAVAKLEGSVERSILLIFECAKEAASIDLALREGRENVEMAARRDDLRNRLGSILYGAEGVPTEATSEAADVVTSRVAAFHDLKAALIDQRHAS